MVISRVRAALRQRLTIPNSSRYYLDLDAAAAGASVPPGARVLDAGAGPAPYRRHFAHSKYETADFAATYDVDYVCTLDALPMPDETYDLVFSSQVLEHVPDPVAVMRELARVTKPGGRLWLSAPLYFAEHQQPYDFYRYTQFAWRHLAKEADLVIEDLAWLEGYYGTLSYQLKTAVQHLDRRWLVLRAAFLVLAHLFARLDMRHRVTDRGMPKNYRVILRKEN